MCNFNHLSLLPSKLPTSFLGIAILCKQILVDLQITSSKNCPDVCV